MDKQEMRALAEAYLILMGTGHDTAAAEIWRAARENGQTEQFLHATLDVTAAPAIGGIARDGFDDAITGAIYDALDSRETERAFRTAAAIKSNQSSFWNEYVNPFLDELENELGALR